MECCCNKCKNVFVLWIIFIAKTYVLWNNAGMYITPKEEIADMETNIDLENRLITKHSSIGEEKGDKGCTFSFGYNNNVTSEEKEVKVNSNLGIRSPSGMEKREGVLAKGNVYVCNVMTNKNKLSCVSIAKRLGTILTVFAINNPGLPC